MRPPGHLCSFVVCGWRLTAVGEFVECVVVEHSDQPVTVPARVADLIGQLAGGAARAPAGQARGGVVHGSSGVLIASSSSRWPSPLGQALPAVTHAARAAHHTSCARVARHAGSTPGGAQRSTLNASSSRGGEACAGRLMRTLTPRRPGRRRALWAVQARRAASPARGAAGGPRRSPGAHARPATSRLRPGFGRFRGANR